MNSLAVTFVRFLFLPLLCALWLGAIQPLRAVSLIPFYTFATSEPFYEGGAVQTPDGALYTLITNPAPTLLRFAPDGTLTSFPIAGHSQDAISGPLLLAGDGNFYGVILGGSPNDAQGSLVRLTPGGVLTRLHVFTGDDGTYPQPGLVQGPDGALYGATTFAPDTSGVPSGDAGTVFRCTLDGTLTTLHRFAGGTNAPVPQGTLTVGRDGNLYGLASSVLFSVTPGGVYTLIHDFTTYGYSDRPNPGFVQDSAGFFYGTTSTGGSEDAAYPFALGTVFRFTPAGQVTILCRFNGQIGSQPIGPLSVGPDGNFYGVLSNGGDGNEIDDESGGALFRLTPAGEVTTVYHDHTDTGLHSAPVGLTFAADGSFYLFTPDGLLRGQLVGAGSLGLTTGNFYVEASDGFAYLNFYRTDDVHGAVSVDYATTDDTARAGVDYVARDGTVRWADGDSDIKTVRITLPPVSPTAGVTSTQFTVQLSHPTGGAALLPLSTATVVVGNSTYAPPGVGVSSCFTFSGGVDGATLAALYPGGDGSLIGATGGSGNNGDQSTLFRFAPDGSLRVLADSAFLESTGLIQGLDGNFYGTRFLPDNPDLTLCRLTPDGTLTVVADLGPSASEEVAVPYRTLLQAHDGSFYGAVETGSYNTDHQIRLFHVTADGTQTILRTLPGNDPVYLLEGTDGQLYGLRYTDAQHVGGFVFGVSPTGDYRVVHDFTTDVDGPGRPMTPLYRTSNGRFCGLAAVPDDSQASAFYQLNPRNGKVKVLHRFIGQEGTPTSEFFPGDDGNFYGTATSSALLDGTLLYRLTRHGDLAHVFYTGQNSRQLQLLAYRSDGAAFLTDDYNDGKDLYRLDTTDTTGPTVEIHTESTYPVSPGTKETAVLTRTGNLDVPLTLSYTISGTARPGIDYQPVSGTVTIPAGRVSAHIPVKTYPLSYYAPSRIYTLDLALKPATDHSYQLSPNGEKVEFMINGSAD